MLDDLDVGQGLVATAIAPASVGNVAVGFDILGHSIEGPHDMVRVYRSNRPGVRILSISGCVETLPFEPERNTAGRALVSLCQAGLAVGFDIEIHKGIPLGSGLGGSAASCVAALVAANALLDEPLARIDLYPYAMDGELVAAGSRHGDNVGPLLLGGLVLATADRLEPLPVPDWLFCAVVRPDQSLETRRARDVLQAPFEIAQIVRQNANLATFLLGLGRGDEAMIASGLKDELVEPRRAPMIPGFDAVTAAARSNGCLGTSISGAGPSIFAWCNSRRAAQQIGEAMSVAFSKLGIPNETFVSPVAGPAAKLL